MITLHTNLGDISIELDHVNTPKTAENFVKYAKNGHYDGLIFHRVIKDFVIQAGGFDSNMASRDPQQPIRNEADTGEKNTKGSLAMARTMDPHSACAQFFINLKDNDFLNHRSKSMEGWGYCVFGKVVDGMDVVSSIGGVKTSSAKGHDDVPVEPVVIESLTIQED